MRITLRLVLLYLLSMSTWSCATKTAVVLVPDPEGRVGVAAVRNGAGSVAISSPYSITTVDNASKPPTAPEAISKEELRKRFSDAMSVQPEKPLRFLFYFKHETEPSPESLEALSSIIAAIHQRKSGYVSVVGHADTTGVSPYNVDVTLRRAIVVRNLLVEGGVAAVTIYPSWVGEENLLIPTKDEVREPKNRGVEVVVR